MHFEISPYCQIPSCLPPPLKSDFILKSILTHHSAGKDSKKEILKSFFGLLINLLVLCRSKEIGRSYSVYQHASPKSCKLMCAEKDFPEEINVITVISFVFSAVT